MKVYLTTLILLQALFIYCQNNEEYNFNFLNNVEYPKSFSNEELGLIISFRFWNQDDKIGLGGGWLIYEKGTKQIFQVAKQLYPKQNRPGLYLAYDLFAINSKSPSVDSTMLNKFDIYLYRVDLSYLKKRLNTDGEGGGKTYSYYETYPLQVDLFKRNAGQNFFVKECSYNANTEDEYLEILQNITKQKKEIARKSN